MGSRYRSHLLWWCIITTSLVAPSVARKPYITTIAEYTTECKTCPHTLCPNELAYDRYDDHAFNVTCWTRGTEIMGDNTWLMSEAGCYVTQYDLVEYNGDYITDLEYCGRDSEEERITTEDATLKYKSECMICTSWDCEIAAYLPEETDVTLTCWYEYGQKIIDDRYWFKTTNNCYVSRTGLYSKPDLTLLDNCGPVPFLTLEDRDGIDDPKTLKRSPSPAPSSLGPSYLINVTVGEEYSYCRSCPKESCSIDKTFEFNDEVWVQCLYTAQEPIEGGGVKLTWWTLTTDFCYIKADNFWQDPYNNYRMPLCYRFGEG